jgi:predicted nucleic acid-binding protein
MENSGVVVDTSIFIDYLRAKDKRNTVLFGIPDNQRIYISSVTLYELLMGATDRQKIKDVHLLIDDTIILPFDEEVSIQGSEIYHDLRKSNTMIEFRDIFIASTCLIHNLPIMTANKKHFQRIKGLKMK